MSLARTGGLRAGLTLIEIVLVVALLAMLFGVMVFSLAGTVEDRALREAAFRFEAALGMARAEACNTARRIRLEFDEETGAAQVLWEPDPPGEPGVFVAYQECTWSGLLSSEKVRVVRCELTGASAFRMMDIEDLEFGSSDENELQTITFYCDGTSDSALVELAPVDESNNLRAVIEFDGQTFRIVRHMLTADEVEEYNDAREP